MKIRFIGTSDKEFTYGKEYKLLNIQINDDFAILWTVDDNNKITSIPYMSLTFLNENWEVVDE